MASMNKGFSLVELAIVLAIIGLLVGGVLAGSEMLRNSEVAAVATHFTTYESATKQFKDTYGYYPGDFPRATDIWGTASSCPGTVSTPSTDETTCDGDGDGTIEHLATASSQENMRAWQHLSNAGLIDGQFSGVMADTVATRYRYCIPNLNCPEGPISKSAFVFQSSGNIASSNTWRWAGNANNVITYGRTNLAMDNMDNVLSPKEALSIDLKLDDGKPSTGKLRTGKATNCPTTNVLATAEYDVSTSNIECNLNLRMSTKLYQN